MTDKTEIQKLQHCLDEYMMHTGRHEINEIEANSALARAGLLEDEAPNPGRPLREILVKLRDSNLLPQNIRQIYGQWKIKLSGTPQVSFYIAVCGIIPPTRLLERHAMPLYTSIERSRIA